TLFDYSFVDEKWFDARTGANLISPLDGAIPEFAYLSACATDPKLHQHLEKVGFTRKLSHDEKVSFLFDEGLYLYKDYKSFLPRPYVLLRLQVLLCNSFNQGHRFNENSRTALQISPEGKYEGQRQLSWLERLTQKFIVQPTKMIIRDPLYRLLG